jgi:hypothetical protein
MKSFAQSTSASKINGPYYGVITMTKFTRCNPEKMKEAGWRLVTIPLWGEPFFRAMAKDFPEDVHDEYKGMYPRTWLRNAPLEKWELSRANIYNKWRKEFLGR